MSAYKLLHRDNIIYLPRGPLGRYVSRRTLCERGLVLMVTYSELFQFVIMLCAVITLVIHYRRGLGLMVTYTDLFTFVIMLCAIITLVKRKK